MVVNPLSVVFGGAARVVAEANRGKVLVEADEREAILFAEVGECGRFLSLSTGTDRHRRRNAGYDTVKTCL